VGNYRIHLLFFNNILKILHTWSRIKSSFACTSKLGVTCRYEGASMISMITVSNHHYVVNIAYYDEIEKQNR
jgi:hypothetical protein